MDDNNVINIDTAMDGTVDMLGWIEKNNIVTSNYDPDYLKYTSDINIHEDVTVQLIDSMGGDFSIVQAARVSVQGANDIFDKDKDSGLINYLMREKHGSPFEHNSLKFYVKAPIMVFREFQRHRIASYNEMSGRYTEMLPDFYIPSRNRPLVNVGTAAKPEMAPGTDEQYYEMSQDQYEVFEFAWMKYKKQLANGVCNEIARDVLPLGMFSQMYVTMNLRSIFNFLSLRTHDTSAKHVSRPQREIEMVAELIEIEIAKLFPIAYHLFNKHGRVAP